MVVDEGKSGIPPLDGSSAIPLDEQFRTTKHGATRRRREGAAEKRDLTTPRRPRDRRLYA